MTVSGKKKKEEKKGGDGDGDGDAEQRYNNVGNVWYSVSTVTDYSKNGCTFW